MKQHTGINRRGFVSVLGGAAATVAMTGCATPLGAAGSMGKVVVIGGGYGGATAAKYLRMWSDKRIDVTLVEPNTSFISCPISNLVVGGTGD